LRLPVLKEGGKLLPGVMLTALSQNNFVKQTVTLMKSYRIVKDNFLGYEAQVKYAWFPFMWIQMNDFYWINSWSSKDQAKVFIDQKKAGKYNINLSEISGSEYEKELKLLVFHPKNFSPEVVWTDKQERLAEQRNRRWRLALPLLNG
jgi:hypothetical protein